MDTTFETWKPVPGYEGLYEVSDHGRVWSIKRLGVKAHRARELKPWHSSGYRWVTLTKMGKQSKFSIHRLVMATFVGPLPDGFVTRHMNG